MARLGRGTPNRPIVARNPPADATVTGTSAQTLAAFTPTASGGYGPSGTSAQTLANFTSSAAGSSVTGTTSQTLAAFTSSASGTYTPSTITGTVAVTLAAFTPTASGSSTVGTSARTLASFTSSASGSYGTDYVYDDFPGSAIDPTKWVVYNRLGDQVNGEVSAVIPANVRVSSGDLLIDQKFEDVSAGDTTTSAPNPRTVHYTSGQISQRAGSFLYGSVRVRAKLPAGTGNWPCIWMLGYEWQPSQPFTANVAGHNWPNDGWWEADIAEFIFDHRTQVNNALHFIGANRGGSGEKTLGFDASSQFAVYRLDWAPTSMTWYVDAEDGSGFVQTLQITGVAGTDIPNTPAYLVIHCAIGGAVANTPVSGTFPTVMTVDYAQVSRTSDSVDQPMGYVYDTLADATSAATGGHGVSGTSSQTLANATPSAAGSSVTGTSARTLANFTSTAAGSFGTDPTGTVAVTLAAFTPNASGSSSVGTSATTLAPVTPTAAGGHGVAGTSAQTLASFTSTASGSSVTGATAATLSAFVAAAGGSSTAGTVARTLAAFTSTATGTAGDIVIIGTATLSVFGTATRAVAVRTDTRIDAIGSEL